MFYNRDQEKATFERMLSKSGDGYDILNVWGEAGIGKTRLLIDAYLPMVAEQGFHSSGLIDLYETEFSRASAIMKMIAETIDSDAAHFNEYYNRRREFEEAREKDQTHVLSYLERKERDVFLDCYSKFANDPVSSNKKTVLFFDTFERTAHGTRFRNWLFSEFLPHTNNTIVVLSGRAGNKIDFPPEITARVLNLPLDPLPDKDAESILEDRIEGKINSEHMNELIRLASGKPLNMVLIANWINNTKVSLEELKDLSSEDVDHRLAKEIWRQVTEEEGATLFALAHIRHRFNQDILEHVANFDPNTARSVIDSLDSRLDIKQRERLGYYQPHDKVRELVYQYLFPQHDPEETVRKGLSNYMLKYYDQELAKETDESERQTLVAERLYHELVVNFDQGLENLEKEFRRAWSSFQHGFWATLLGIAEEFQDYMEFIRGRMEKANELANLTKVYRGWLYQLSWQFQEAETIVEELLQDSSILDSTRALTLRLASTYFRGQGEFQHAVDMGKEALQTYETLSARESENMEFQRRIASVTNDIGFAYRQLGNLEEAIQWYEKALTKSQDQGQLKLSGVTLNNIGNAYRLLGDIQEAYIYCEESLNLAERRGDRRDQALCHNTIGRIYRDDGRFARAQEHFQKAKALFEEVGDQVFMASALRNTGYVYYLAEDFEKSLDFLEQSKQILEDLNLENQLLNTLNKMGRVYRKRGQKGDLDQAEKYHLKALSLSRQYSDFFFKMDTLVELCRINYQRSVQAPFKQKEEYYKTIYGYAQELQQLGENHLAWFRLELVLGDIERDKKDYEKAVLHWGKSFAHIARRNRRRFEICLHLLSGRLKTLPDDWLVTCSEQLVNFWRNEDLQRSFPEVIKLCESKKRHMLRVSNVA